jgi:hypothetical protein
VPEDKPDVSSPVSDVYHYVIIKMLLCYYVAHGWHEEELKIEKAKGSGLNGSKHYPNSITY